MIYCNLCSKKFNTLQGLHGHLSKTHSWQQCDYYHTFSPRYDMYTKELIKYKDFKQYFSDRFNSRENFAKWFSENYKEPGTANWCLLELEKRFEDKKNRRLPSHFELKSLFLPTIYGWQKIFSNTSINSEFLDRQVVVNFDYGSVISERELGDLTIYQDSREQLPLLLDCNVEKMKLPVGDYTIAGDYFDNIYVERKSLNDLVGTLTSGLDRFISEIEKAKTLDAYIVVIIEDLFDEIYHYTSTNKYTKRVNGAFLLKVIRNIMSNHDNIQFVAVGSRRAAAKACVTILKAGATVRRLDLQYLNDKQLL